MISGEAKEEVPRHCNMRVRRARLEVRRQAVWTLQTSSTHFKLNASRDEKCYRIFRFRHKEIGELVEVCGWKSGKNKRNEYVMDSMTAVCVMMRELSFSTRWKGVEKLFGQRHSALSEVFYEDM